MTLLHIISMQLYFVFAVNFAGAIVEAETSSADHYEASASPRATS